MRKADLNEDGAYDERELTKVMFDMTDMMIKKIFDWNTQPLPKSDLHSFFCNLHVPLQFVSLRLSQFTPVQKWNKLKNYSILNMLTKYHRYIDEF